MRETVEHGVAAPAADLSGARPQLVRRHPEQRLANRAAGREAHVARLAGRVPVSSTQPSSTAAGARWSIACIARRHVLRLRFENAGEDEAPAASDAGGEQRREGLERIREDVRDHDVVLAAALGIRTNEPRGDAILICVAGGRNHRLRVDVHADRLPRTELHGRDRENARTAAVVEHALTARDLARQPCQAEPGGRDDCRCRRRRPDRARRSPRPDRAPCAKWARPRADPRSGSAGTGPGSDAPSRRRPLARRAARPRPSMPHAASARRTSIVASAPAGKSAVKRVAGHGETVAPGSPKMGVSAAVSAWPSAASTDSAPPSSRASDTRSTRSPGTTKWMAIQAMDLPAISRPCWRRASVRGNGCWCRRAGSSRP